MRAPASLRCSAPSLPSSLSFSVSQPLLPSERTRTSSSAGTSALESTAPRASALSASRSFGASALTGNRGLSGSFFESGLGLLRDRRKALRLVHGEVGEHLAIDLDAGLLDAIDETAVAQVELARRRVDALDPQCAEVALLEPATAVGVLAGLDDGLLRRAEYLATRVVVALRLLENFLVACTCSDAAFDSCHLLVLAALLGIGHQLVDAVRIALVNERRTTGAQLALGLARLVAEIVAAASGIGFPSLRCFAKTLGRCPVGLQLGHTSTPL